MSDIPAELVKAIQAGDCILFGLGRVSGQSHAYTLVPASTASLAASL